MLSTLIIGLREGLEAALIVGIIATFLKRSGHSLRAMWVGVSAAVLVSIGVGVALMIATTSLPQAQQEALETIIGAVAIVFVTTMIIWMDSHARNLKGVLEANTESALSSGSAFALAGMAFLAVLKEGFETSVFLLATVQATGSSYLGLIGAIVGIAIAATLGVGIYFGGIKLNLGKFFKITGAFLVLVAAGLVLSTLRTAHEAGWLNAGQGTTLDLSWLVPTGSVQSALVTGVFGIPRDPRLIELIGWLTYTVATLTYLFLPQTRKVTRPTAIALGFAGAFTALAITLMVAVPLPTKYSAKPLAISTQSGDTFTTSTAIGTAKGSKLVLIITDASNNSATTTLGLSTKTTVNGISATEYRKFSQEPVQYKSMSLFDVIQLNGNRTPVGLDRTVAPGPYSAKIRESTTEHALISHYQLLAYTSAPKWIVTLSGGGLPSAKTFTAQPSYSATTDTKVTVTIADSMLHHKQQTDELLLWKFWLPLGYLLVALVICGFAIAGRSRRQHQQQLSAPQPTSRLPNHRTLSAVAGNK